MRRVMAALLLPLTAAAVLPAQQEEKAPDPVTWTIHSSRKSVKPGERFMVRLMASIDEGWHLYSMRQQEGGPIPMTITAPMPQLFQIAGLVDAPVALTAHEELFGMEVEYYFGEVEFGVPMRAYKEARPEKAKLTLAARYQVCDSRQCLPPKTVKLDKDVEIAGQ
jgi:DsbC/DsbD-like thiol-disulfide interchange protein